MRTTLSALLRLANAPRRRLVIGAALVALLAGAVSVGAATACLPAAGAVLAAGLLVGGLGVPALSGLISRPAGRRQATARGHLAAELVGLVQAAPDTVAFGAEADA